MEPVIAETVRRMFVYVIEVDDQVHEISLAGDPVGVAAVGDVAVQFRAENRSPGYEMLRYFRVFGTGKPLPDNARWRGTCPRTPAGLVWHLYEIDFDQ